MQTKESIRWIDRYDGGPHEANFLKLDCSKLKSTFGWKPRWSVEEAMERIAEWTDCYLSDGDVRGITDKQIEDYVKSIIIHNRSK